MDTSSECDLDVRLDDTQRFQIDRYVELLVENNRQFNLTSPGSSVEIRRRLVSESLRLVPYFEQRMHDGVAVVDIGTGSGVPGITLAVTFPSTAFTLIDATAKKVRFLEQVSRELELSNVSPVHGRVENLAHESHYRDQFDVATARAVGSLSTLTELTMPFLKIGGEALLVKGELPEEEVERAHAAARILGASAPKVDRLPDIPDMAVTQLVRMARISDVVAKYPRRAGIPAKDPLGGKADERTNLLP